MLHLIALRAPSAEIARLLSLSSKTVAHYASDVLHKLQVADRKEADGVPGLTALERYVPCNCPYSPDALPNRPITPISFSEEPKTAYLSQKRDRRTADHEQDAADHTETWATKRKSCIFREGEVPRPRIGY